MFYFVYYNRRCCKDSKPDFILYYGFFLLASQLCCRFGLFFVKVKSISLILNKNCKKEILLRKDRYYFIGSWIIAKSDPVLKRFLSADLFSSVLFKWILFSVFCLHLSRVRHLLGVTVKPLFVGTVNVHLITVESPLSLSGSHTVHLNVQLWSSGPPRPPSEQPGLSHVFQVSWLDPWVRWSFDSSNSKMWIL